MATSGGITTLAALLLLALTVHGTSLRRGGPSEVADFGEDPSQLETKVEDAAEESAGKAEAPAPATPAAATPTPSSPAAGTKAEAGAKPAAGGNEKKSGVPSSNSPVIGRSGDWKPPSSNYINKVITPTPVVTPEDDDVTTADVVKPLALPGPPEEDEPVFVPELGVVSNPSDSLLNSGMGESPETVLREPNDPVLQEHIAPLDIPSSPKHTSKGAQIPDIMDHSGNAMSNAENQEIGSSVTDDFRILPAEGEGSAGHSPDTDRGKQDATAAAETGADGGSPAAAVAASGSEAAPAAGEAKKAEGME